MPKISDPLSDLELLRIMRDKGYELCQEARHKWWSGKYSPGCDDMCPEMIQHWYSNEARIKKLYYIFWDYLKTMQKEGDSA